VYHSAHVELNEVGLEQRLSSLQTQIDHLRHAASDDVLPLEERLSTLTDYTSGILKRWSATADRHARAVTQLENHLRELGDAGNRLHHDASQRLQDLERLVQQEWNALRDVHEVPVRQLIEQASALTEVCIATANSAQHGFDRAESRLAALEADFHRTAMELTREVQTLVTEVRQLSAGGQRQIAAPPPSWPLEGVTRLHQQLRESSADSSPAPALPALIAAPSELEHEQHPPLEAESDPIDPVTPPIPAVTRPAGLESRPNEPARSRSFSRVGLAVVVGLFVTGGILTWRLQRDVRTVAQQVERSQLQSQNAEAASRQAAVKQEAADRELLAARDLATRAQTIGDVLAAPDLVRYTLTNAAATVSGPSGQVLWSRSRGFVFSASGLPAPPENATYQIWLLTRGGPVSAATFVPDAAGRITVTTTPGISRPVIGAIVTTEPKDGAGAPSSEPVLARLPAAPAQS
jgi:hypothetical protein